MTRMQVYFNDEHKDELIRWARDERRKFSEILREIVANAIKERRGTQKNKKFSAWSKFIGAGKSKDKNVAKNIDKILYIDPYK